MSDGRPKPSIPAWQRAPISASSSKEDSAASQPDVENQPSADGAATESDQEQDNDDSKPIPSVNVPSSENMKVQDSIVSTSEFEAFKQQEQQQQQQQPEPQQARPSAPPIITYPEFLVEAHKPPPFITPTRVLNAVYAAGGAATLLYAASKWIVNPMVDTLSESRHEFFTHSQSKVDELNERLAKIVSKVPEAKKGHDTSAAVIDDGESETSDPTELYHRDIGTQTSPIVTPAVPEAVDEKTKDAVTYQTGALDIMKEHINELADGSDRAAEAVKDRQDTVNKLRHYLDSLTWSHTTNLWQTSEDATKTDKSDDTIEGLKKEIRGVKGVLLSAKRFPAVSRPLSGAA